MLSNEDLHAIGTIVDEKLDKKFDEKLEPVLEAIKEGFDEMTKEMATKKELAALGTELRGEMKEMKHELMDHTDRVVGKAVGDLRAELRAADVLA